MSYKSDMPYIPDKSMYAAVMGACRYIRATGYFSRAVSYYANLYDVDADELAAHIRARQSVGQKRKNAKTKRVYKYFVCDRWIHRQHRDDYNYEHTPNIQVIKAVSREHAARNNSGITSWGYQNESYSEWICTVIAEFDTKAEADEYAEKLKGRYVL